MTARLKIAKATKQQGFVLVVGLIMLVLLTLMVVTTFRIGSTETIIVANAQHSKEGIDAAQLAIDTVANSNNFTQNPAAAIPTSNCTGGGANSLCVDVNGDNKPDFRVTLTPQPSCVMAVPIPANQLDFSKADDLACATETQQTFGVAGATVTGNSLCANSMWDITAQATDSATGTTSVVSQGIAVRIATSDVATNCP